MDIALEHDLVLYVQPTIGYQGVLGGFGALAQCGNCGAALPERDSKEGLSDGDTEEFIETYSEFEARRHCSACGNKMNQHQTSTAARLL